MQTILTKALAVGFAASVAVGGNTTPQTSNVTITPAAIYSKNGNIVVLSSADYGNESDIDAWLDKLAFLESEGRSDLKILDQNGLHSFGCLQFQLSTFKEFGERYDLIPENGDAGKLIYDCELQKKIAKLMLLENPGNWRRWYTSVVTKGLGLPPVKKLELLSLK